MGTKRMELLNKDSCFNKAGLDEFLLVLRAKDFYCAVPAAKAWFIEARRQSKHTEKLADFQGFLEDFEANGKAIEAGNFHLEKMTPNELLDFLIEEITPETVEALARINAKVDEMTGLENQRLTFVVALVAEDVISGLMTAAEVAAPIAGLFPSVTLEDIIKRIEVKVDEDKATAQRFRDEIVRQNREAREKTDAAQRQVVEDEGEQRRAAAISEHVAAGDGPSKTAGGPVEAPPPAQDSPAGAAG